MRKEIWKDVKGFKGRYKISNYGRLKSLDRWVRKNGSKTFYKGKIISLAIDSDGYYVAGLYKNGGGGNKRINRLVALHFIPNPNKLPIVDHIKGNKLDNRAWMLEWVTNRENIARAYDNGLIIAAKGEKCGASKFTQRDILNLRQIHSMGVGPTKLSEIFGMSLRNVHLIIKRKTWTHI